VELNLEHRSQRDSSSPISLHDDTEDIEAFSRTVEDIMNSSSVKLDSFSQNPSAVNIMSSSYLASSDLYRGFFPLQHNGKESGGKNRFPDYHDLLATQNTAWGNQRVVEGIAAAREEKYETAIEFCNAALSVLPNSVQAFVCRGASYASISKYERAVLDFERALELDPVNQNAKQYLNKIVGKEQRVTPNTMNIILPVESAQTRMVFAERHMYPSKVRTKDLTRGPSSSSSSKVEDDSNTKNGAVDTVNGYTFEREDRGDSSDNDSQISTSTKKRKREKEGKHRKSSSSKNEKEKKNHKHKERKKPKKEKNDST